MALNHTQMALIHTETALTHTQMALTRTQMALIHTQMALNRTQMALNHTQMASNHSRAIIVACQFKLLEIDEFRQISNPGSELYCSNPICEHHGFDSHLNGFESYPNGFHVSFVLDKHTGHACLICFRQA